MLWNCSSVTKLAASNFTPQVLWGERETNSKFRAAGVAPYFAGESRLLAHHRGVVPLGGIVLANCVHETSSAFGCIIDF